MQYLGGNTATGAALTFAKDHLFNKRNGHRKNAKKVAIVITDGESLQDDPTVPAKELRRSGVEIFAIGVGDKVNQEELRTIATNPDKEHVFHVDNFIKIIDIEREILRDVCKVTGRIY